MEDRGTVPGPVEPGEAQTVIDESRNGWARSIWDEMPAFSSDGMYLNFPGMGEE